MGLFTELRRRNVIKVAIAYAITAWLLVEISATTFPMLQLPEWTATFVTVLLIIGFPLALIFAWAFELTPEGIKFEREIVRSESISYLTGRKLDYLIIAVLVAALSYFAIDRFVFDPSRNAELLKGAPVVAVDSDVEEAADLSIAVLAFADLSPMADQEYFSDGISEELLNVLAKIPGLRVAARTSSFQFKGENRDIIEIGRQLNTSYVLEGSVRKAGSEVRITAQLIDASNGFHLWSESYDRELQDILALQDEVSAAIVVALTERLGLQVGTVPQISAAANVDAYDAYLRGRHLVMQRTKNSIEGAVDEFEKAITTDPDYALAHAELAIATLFLTVYGDLTLNEAFARAAPHVERAIALDPDLAQGYAANGYLLRFQGLAEQATVQFKQAVRINPNYAIVYNAMGVLLGEYQGRYPEAFDSFETSLRLDPLSIPASNNYINQLIARNRLEEAELELEKLAAISPAYYATQRGLLAALSGNWAEAVLAYLDALRLNLDRAGIWRDLARYLAAIRLEDEALAISRTPPPLLLSWIGNHKDAVSAAEAHFAKDPLSVDAHRDLGQVLAAAGDYSRGRAILEEMWRRSEGRVTESGPVRIQNAVALILLRRESGDEVGVDELLAAIRDNVRRREQAGLILSSIDYSVDYAKGIAAYLSGERETGLVFISKAVEDGYLIPTNEAYLEGLYGNPGFAPIRERQEARQAREREKFLAVVCDDNPYAAIWQPLDGTCEQHAAIAVD
jgi:TolB-like protein/Tfp pilus assembly protein PilF